MTAAVVVAVGALGGLTACDPPATSSTLTRPTAPVILTGAKVPSLVGAAPNRIVAFRFISTEGSGEWQPVPVQVDQRKVVPFGSQPASNTTPGVTGTVYGNGSGGPTALQYADPNTFVGADPNPTFDADDELVFMAADAGGQPGAGAAEPAGVVAGSGVAVQVTDPRASAERGWMYLFRSTGGLDPSAGQDYVVYTFALTSGPYKTSYRRNQGPNPETSKVVTPTYEAGFTDRWKETVWKVRAPGASGVDVLDGHMNQFALDNCVRSNQTFVEAEGAFVANIDGPVRAIRSYVGANSGPRTQRTHLMYRDREVTVTDLRVHPIPEVMDFVDLSAAAQGMTYRTSTRSGRVTVNGVADAVPTAIPQWEALDGPQGQILYYNQFTSSAPGVTASAQQLYRDEADANPNPCWGDGSRYGAAGTHITATIPNTDPGAADAATLQGRRVTQFGAPAADPDAIAAKAADWSADIRAPLRTTVTNYQP